MNSLCRTKCLYCLLLVVLASSARCDDTSDLIHEWLGIESQRGVLRSEWEQSKNILDGQIELYQKQISEYRRVVASKSNSTDGLDEKRQEITDAQALLEEKQARIKDEIDIALHHLRRMQSRLPPFIRTDLSEDLDNINTDNTNVGNTVDGIVAAIQSLYQLNQRITVNKSSIFIEDAGQDIHVSQVYLGLGHAWYVSDDDANFGYGRSTQSGWRWWNNEASSELFNDGLKASDIRKLVWVIENPQQAEFSRLPIAID